MQNATEELQPSGRSYQARMLGLSAALSFAAVGIIDLYLVALLRMSASEWTRFAALVGVFFVVIFALQARLQGVPLPGIGTVPTQAIQALPYLATVLLHAGFVGRAIAPKAIGQPYVKER